MIQAAKPSPIRVEWSDPRGYQAAYYAERAEDPKWREDRARRAKEWRNRKILEGST